jgi:hypothetical protein
MSKKHKAQARRTSYFAEFRDYSNAVAAELAFFNGLLAAKDHIRSISSNPSLRAALSQVAAFLLDQGRPLNIVVKFLVTDPRSEYEHTLLLGTQLEPPQPECLPQVTHFLCLADADSLLMKVHTDLDCHANAQEKKPSPHIQIGGRVPPTLWQHCFNVQPKVSWNTQVDKPRLPALPTCTALLWHWAFLEYSNSEEASDFLGAHHWKQLVKDAEATVLRPYFSDGLQLIQRRPAAGLLNALYVPLSK